MEKYDRIGKTYNATRQADPFLASKMEELLKLQKKSTYLDIGCGSGNYTGYFADKGFKFVGVDPSHEMLKKALKRSQRVNWKNGAAEEIPLAEESVDGVLASLTIHHWKSLNKAFQEINRVLKPGGKFLIFTSTPRQMEKYWMNHYFPRMMEKSIAQMPSMDNIEDALFETGLSISKLDKYFIQKDLKDHFLLVGKDNPGIYLDKKVRDGISSFADLSISSEVNTGLIHLQEDIANGDFASIKESFDNDLGDYLFILLEKK